MFWRTFGGGRLGDFEGDFEGGGGGFGEGVERFEARFEADGERLREGGGGGGVGVMLKNSKRRDRRSDFFPLTRRDLLRHSSFNLPTTIFTRVCSERMGRGWEGVAVGFALG